MANVNEILSELSEISKHPGEQLKKHLAAGKKVIGVLPYYNPEPLVAACGMVPIGMWGAQINPSLAGRYSPIFACSLTRSILELGMNGTYKGVSAVIMPILCDTLRGEVSAWRAGVKDIPMIPFIQPQNRMDPGAQDFLIAEYTYVKEELEKIAGVTLTNKDIDDAINLYNKKYAVMREFTQIAKDHLDIINAVVRHSVMKAATFMTAEETIEKVSALNEALKAEPKCDWKGKKVVLTGITCEPDGLLQYFVDNKVAVVADDLAQESRLYRTDYPLALSAMQRLAMQWMNIRGCSLVHDDNVYARGEQLVKTAKDAGADCVILCMMRFCDIEEYDQPYVANYVRDAGLNTFSIDIDQSTAESGQALTKIQAYAEN